MNTEEVSGADSKRRRYWSVAEKRRMVELTFSSALSVASLARQEGINANQLFLWRRLYQAGQLDSDGRLPEHSMRLLPVQVSDEEQPSVPKACVVEAVNAEVKDDAVIGNAAHSITMHIEIPGRAVVRLEGAVDRAMIRAVLETLRR